MCTSISNKFCYMLSAFIDHQSSYFQELNHYLIYHTYQPYYHSLTVSSNYQNFTCILHLCTNLCEQCLFNWIFKTSVFAFLLYHQMVITALSSCIELLVRAKCVRCPWALQAERSVHCWRHFSLSSV